MLFVETLYADIGGKHRSFVNQGPGQLFFQGSKRTPSLKSNGVNYSLTE